MSNHDLGETMEDHMKELEFEISDLRQLSEYQEEERQKLRDEVEALHVQILRLKAERNTFADDLKDKKVEVERLRGLFEECWSHGFHNGMDSMSQMGRSPNEETFEDWIKENLQDEGQGET
jgi:regulator of replication initiation timing